MNSRVKLLLCKRKDQRFCQRHPIYTATSAFPAKPTSTPTFYYLTSGSHLRDISSTGKNNALCISSSSILNLIRHSSLSSRHAFHHPSLPSTSNISLTAHRVSSVSTNRGAQQRDHECQCPICIDHHLEPNEYPIQDFAPHKWCRSLRQSLNSRGPLFYHPHHRKSANSPTANQSPRAVSPDHNEDRRQSSTRRHRIHQLRTQRLLRQHRCLKDH